MKKCADFNTKKRMNTANDFEKDFLNRLADQHTLDIKKLVKIMLLFMKLNQF